jgi:CRP-like cAMP-binding protein
MDASRLKSSPLFDGISDEDLASCAEHFDETEILAGSSLSNEGDFAYKFFVVLDGQVEVLRDFHPVAQLGPGDFFGEMALVSGERRNARVTAVTRCDLASIIAWDFQKMTDEFPQIAERIEAKVVERMASLPTDEG